MKCPVYACGTHWRLIISVRVRDRWQVEAPYIPKCSGPGDASNFDEYDEEPINVAKTEKFVEEFEDF